MTLHSDTAHHDMSPWWPCRRRKINSLLCIFLSSFGHPDLGKVKTHIWRATYMNCQGLGRVWKLIKFRGLNFHQDTSCRLRTVWTICSVNGFSFLQVSDLHSCPEVRTARLQGFLFASCAAASDFSSWILFDKENILKAINKKKCFLKTTWADGGYNVFS